MARAGPDDHRRPFGDLGARVDVTVVPGPRGPTLRERVAPRGNRRAIGFLAAAALAAGALVAGISLTGRGGTTRLLPTTALPTTVLPNTVLYPTYLTPRGPAAAPPAAAYPLRCLSLLIALHDPSLMNGAFDRKLPCGRARGPYTLVAIGLRQSGAKRRASQSPQSRRG